MKVHVLPKYACPKCRDGVASPPVPPRPVPGGMAGPGLVAFVVVSKFADHLPLYRLEDILTRHGVSLSRSTLCDWVRDAAVILEPLAALQKARVLQSPVIWTDDTPVTVLGGETPGSSNGRFWVYIGDDEHPYSVYDFSASRCRDGPAAFLNDYRGFLQADAYGGYDGIFLGSDGGVMEVACSAHARRKFYDARSNAPREANQVLEWIRQLYDIEDWARELTAAERLALRQREAVPILDRIETYLDELSQRVLPKSALGKAVTYARNQRAALRQYVSDGRLTIDNNVSERTLRLQAIGRKNWEFLGSAAAGPRAAVLFTILAGAKRHRLEPWAYLRDVLLRLSAGETDLESLLPDRWAASHPEHVLEHRLDESRRKAARQKATRERRRAKARAKASGSPGRWRVPGDEPDRAAVHRRSGIGQVAGHPVRCRPALSVGCQRPIFSRASEPSSPRKRLIAAAWVMRVGLVRASSKMACARPSSVRKPRAAACESRRSLTWSVTAMPMAMVQPSYAVLKLRS